MLGRRAGCGVDVRVTSGWEALPVDDIGYVRPAEILRLSEVELRDWTAEFEDRRYGGWRNHDNLWRSTLGLDSTTGKHVIDYGCGFGIEALQFARAGNTVTLFDLTDDGLGCAARVLAVHGFDCDIARDGLPEADIFYANGVLHHFADGMAVLNSAPCPEARVMLYSDRAWQRLGGPDFWQRMDDVGGYADWYSPEKLEDATRGHWTVERTAYITPDGRYLTATLTR